MDDLPEGLDETYERILKEIRKPNQKHAHRMLQCLVAAVRPLRVEELAEVLAFDFDVEGIPKLNPDWRWEQQEEAIILACSSLVTIVEDEKSRIVQFSHFSVKEFLTANRLANPVRDISRYHIQLDAAHTILAQACLGVIFRIDDHISQDTVKKSFPLALYAGRYWMTHAQFETVSSRIKDGMKRLFDADQPYFAIWLWLHDGDLTIFQTLSSMFPQKPEAVPLYYAAKFGFRDLAEHLIAEHPEYLNARGGFHNTPIHAAAYEGHTDILTLLLDHGVDINDRNKSGETPLRIASSSGHLEAGWYLIDRGADINAADDGKNTIVSRAFRGHVESIRKLIRLGAVIDIRNSNGENSLHMSVRSGSLELVRLYLDLGLDPNLPNYWDDTPYDLALKCGHPDVLELLIEYGATCPDPKVCYYSHLGPIIRVRADGTLYPDYRGMRPGIPHRCPELENANN